VNEYLRDLYERVPHDWTPLSELDAPWEYLNELAQDGYLGERVEKLERDGLTVGSRFHYRKLTKKERELRERVKATERLEWYYVPWAEQWREEHGDEPVPSEVAAEWVERAKRLQAQKPGAYYTPSDVCGDVYDPAMGSGGFLAAMSNPNRSSQ